MNLRGVVVEPQNVQNGSNVRATTYLDSDTGFGNVEVDFYVSDSPTWKGDRAVRVGQAYTDQSGVATLGFTFDPVQLAPAIATANLLQSVIPDQLGLNLGGVGKAKLLYLVAYCPQSGDGVAASIAYDSTGMVPVGGTAIGSGSINAQIGQGAQIQIGSGTGQAAPVTNQAVSSTVSNAPTGASGTSLLSVFLVLVVIGVLGYWATQRIR